jgi:hypothetical protein
VLIVNHKGCPPQARRHFDTDADARRHCEETWPGCQFAFTTLRGLATPESRFQDHPRLDHIILVVFRPSEVSPQPVEGYVLALDYDVVAWDGATVSGELAALLETS